ncbi:hypothetical protein EDD86DRAFT_205204 [Gorgonomyces haynaldii]|nr:hypothetical protein EDD86DRAFT_205204 [Gorgonomyces haynaldii]
MNCLEFDQSKKNIQHPIGFSLEHKPGKNNVQEQELQIQRLKLKKAYELAFSGAKSIPMNGFMLYMSGNGIQIFSIMMTGMLLYNSAMQILGSRNQFKQFEQQSGILLPLLLFILIQGVNFGLGMWKLGQMGLLPTSTSDWLSFLAEREIVVIASGGLEY